MFFLKHHIYLKNVIFRTDLIFECDLEMINEYYFFPLARNPHIAVLGDLVKNGKLLGKSNSQPEK